MKKKILIIMPSMFIGGAERSLLGLLEALDYTRVEVSLFLYRHEGEFLQAIPEQVHILPEMEQYRTFDVPIKSLLLSTKAIFGFARLASKAALKMHCFLSGEKHGVWMSMQYTARYLLPLLPNIPGEYDLAVMFLGVGDVLIHKVRARSKVTWCHTDYGILGPSKHMDLQTYSAVDRVVAVSEECAVKIRKTYPELTSKIMVIGNMLAINLIQNKATEPISDMAKTGSELIILSIGRYSYAKNFDNVPAICKRIVEMGLNVKWYIIGYGGDEQLICEKIKEAGMDNYVIMLGKKENPYPYISACDLYVQPSRYEGNCVTVHEAQILGKPVVITRYATSKDQLEEGVDGVIVPMDNEGCAEGIAALLRDPQKMRFLSDNCLARDYSNSGELEKLLNLC